MAAQPNIGGAFCENSLIPFLVPRHKVWLAPTTRVPYSNAAKTRSPLKFAGVAQTPELISAASVPKFTILCRHVEEILLLNKFFPDSQYMPSLRRYSLIKLCDGARRQFFASFLHPVFPASHVQHLSDLHSKFALRPHHVWKYGRHPISFR